MPEALRDWHDFYVLLGTASATLIGAMFVVASIGAGTITHDRSAETRTFLTPTVMHLAAALLGSIAAMAPAPALGEAGFGIVYGAGGAIGLAYSCAVTAWTVRRRLVLSDRLWYALVPIAGYGAMLAAAALLLRRDAAAPDVLAAAMVLLLLAGLRNAWDLIIFLVAQHGRPPD